MFRSLVTEVLLAALLLSGCNSRHRSSDTEFLCDHTTSSHCDEESARRAARPFIARPEPGSRFTMMTIGCGSDDLDVMSVIDVPIHWGASAAQKKRAWIEAEERHLGNLRLKRPQRCSGIVGGIDRAARRLRESEKAEKKLLIDSDLREVSAETGFNFERSVPEPSVFVESVRERGLLPDLRGFEITVCGVHPDSTPDARHWSARQTLALHAAWSAFFRAAGVEHIDLLEKCPWEESDSVEISWGGAK